MSDEEAQILAAQQQALDPNDAHLPRTLLQLASVQIQEQKYSDAATLLKRALNMQKADDGPDHPQLIRTLEIGATALGQPGETERPRRLPLAPLPSAKNLWPAGKISPAL